MKKKEIPQDLSALGKITNEVCYAVDETGKYSTGLSKGWDVKVSALNVAWEDVQQRIQHARQLVTQREASPLLFFMEFHIMDTAIVAAYTGFWKWQVKRHLKYAAFERLSEKKLQRYADLFEVTIADLKTMKTHEA